MAAASAIAHAIIHEAPRNGMLAGELAIGIDRNGKSAAIAFQLDAPGVSLPDGVLPWIAFSSKFYGGVTVEPSLVGDARAAIILYDDPMSQRSRVDYGEAVRVALDVYFVKSRLFGQVVEAMRGARLERQAMESALVQIALAKRLSWTMVGRVCSHLRISGRGCSMWSLLRAIGMSVSERMAQTKRLKFLHGIKRKLEGRLLD